MKKCLLLTAIICALSLSILSCRKGTSAGEVTTNRAGSTSSSSQKGDATAPTSSNSNGTTNSNNSSNSDNSTPSNDSTLPVYSKIDLDLTTQSPTMIYAQVFNMMLEPESFEGKIIKLNGACAIFQDESLNRAFYACIVKDATACCAQGLEFVLSSACALSGYPTENEEITITGRFENYKLNGLDSFHLVDTIIEPL